MMHSCCLSYSPISPCNGRQSALRPIGERSRIRRLCSAPLFRSSTHCAVPPHPSCSVVRSSASALSLHVISPAHRRAAVAVGQRRRGHQLQPRTRRFAQRPLCRIHSHSHRRCRNTRKAILFLLAISIPIVQICRCKISSEWMGGWMGGQREERSGPRAAAVIDSHAVAVASVSCRAELLTAPAV